MYTVFYLVIFAASVLAPHLLAFVQTILPPDAQQAMTTPIKQLAGVWPLVTALSVVLAGASLLRTLFTLNPETPRPSHDPGTPADQDQPSTL